MDDDLVPVHLSERHGHVSVLMLLGTGRKLAMYEGDKWKEIGQVHETTVNGKSVWAWHFDELEWDKAHGYEPTKTKAIAELLIYGGYVVAEENATIPDLFELE